MPGSVRRRSAPSALAALVVALTVVLLTPLAAQAHGGLVSPPTRTYVCRFLEPHAKQCEKAWGANPQALYDWMEVNISNAAGRHQALIPDGTLCGAGRDKYGAFNAATDAWPATPVKAGPTEMSYTSTAPHNTSYYRLYITKPGFDIGSPLRWDDLEPLYDSGPLPLAAHNTFPVTLPARTGHHIIYLVWQRSDSQEAFYGCSDVVFPGADGTTGATPVITKTTTDDPEAGGMPMGETSKPGTKPATSPLPAKVVRRGSLSFFTTITNDWGAGFCTSVKVKNRAARPVTWRATLKVSGKITSLWSARARHRGTRLTVRGRAYNARLDAKQSTTFGYCVLRT